jgi:hypothetical protein
MQRPPSTQIKAMAAAGGPIDGCRSNQAGMSFLHPRAGIRRIVWDVHVGTCFDMIGAPGLHSILNCLEANSVKIAIGGIVCFNKKSCLRYVAG